MSDRKKHFKLWAAITSAKNIDALKKYPYFFANSDHILIFAERKPKNTASVTPEFYPLFGKDDWDWISSVTEKIRSRELRSSEDDEKAIVSFLQRYEELLKEKAEEAENAEQFNERGNAESA